MRHLAVLLVAILATSCATTDERILRLGQMQHAALLVVQQNVDKTISTMLEDQKKLLNAGYRQALASGEQQLVDESGRVSLTEYKSYVQDLAEDLATKEQVIENKATQAQTAIGAQLGAVITLGSTVQRYNEATGVTDATFQNLLGASTALVDTGIAAYTDVSARHDAEQEARDQANDLARKAKLSGVVEFMKKVQASKQEGGAPVTPEDIQALIGVLSGDTK